MPTRFLIAGLLLPTAVAAHAADRRGGIPHYQHIFMIVEENRSYDDINWNANAPQLNHLAAQYGQATRFFAEVRPMTPFFQTR